MDRVLKQEGDNIFPHTEICINFKLKISSFAWLISHRIIKDTKLVIYCYKLVFKMTADEHHVKSYNQQMQKQIITHLTAQHIKQDVNLNVELSIKKYSI